MNDRIKELIKQSSKEVWGTNPYNGSPEFEGHELDPEKFAELIVRECVKVCNSRVGNSDYNTGRMHCVSDLKEHFGVEE